MSTKKNGSKGEGLTIADLPEQEKSRITHLVDKLISLGREHEETMSCLSNERARHASEIDAANRRIENELGVVDSKLMQQSETIQQLQEQRAAAFSLLKQYQARLEGYEAASRVQSKADEGSVQRESELVGQVGRLEHVIEKQRASIDDMEVASASAKKAFQETLDLAEERNRRSTEELASLKEQSKRGERRAHGLEQAVTGLTKQIASLNKTCASKDLTIADLRRTIEASDAVLAKEREATAAARADAAAFAAAAASATASATAANAANAAAREEAMRKKKRAAKQAAAELAASRTSSEMLLLTVDGDSRSQSKNQFPHQEPVVLTSERKVTRRSPNDDLARGARPMAAPLSPSFARARQGASTGAGTGSSSASMGVETTAAASKKSKGGAVVASTAAKGRNSDLAVELGQHRHYDSSLLALIFD